MEQLEAVKPPASRFRRLQLQPATADQSKILSVKQQFVNSLGCFRFCRDGTDEDRDVPWRETRNPCLALGRSSGCARSASFESPQCKF